MAKAVKQAQGQDFSKNTDEQKEKEVLLSAPILSGKQVHFQQ